MLKYRTKRTRFKRVYSIVNTYIQIFGWNSKRPHYRDTSTQRTRIHYTQKEFNVPKIPHSKQQKPVKLIPSQCFKNEVNTPLPQRNDSVLKVTWCSSSYEWSCLRLCITSSLSLLSISITLLCRRLRITLLQKKHQIFANHFIIACVCVCVGQKLVASMIKTKAIWEK